jgi:hypothetical protein
MVNNTTTTFDEQTTILKTLLDEFRGLFTQLIQQNGMILNMLSALINNHPYTKTNPTHSALERQWTTKSQRRAQTLPGPKPN